ncbi:hypothetical protein CY34DRAFT_813847 [Suillus luteus UH-Slu-Lm8-n1]|uniref:Unplaced genomic scaffold CY34scaffold_898, whole genome shotgun sequence n=1 Tax=Suillus luteus UH-Slu-Lm8-n1 TaxID=930992 RepID=A0A0C9Z6G4_9AGAM|nr:hypothetical protein CY34DRAFT_813847 [Suillus luteus UH-Slu-Lm8-n1]
MLTKQVVARMPHAVILTLLSWSGISMMLTRKPGFTRMHQRRRCGHALTVYRSPIVIIRVNVWTC